MSETISLSYKNEFKDYLNSVKICFDYSKAHQKSVFMMRVSYICIGLCLSLINGFTLDVWCPVLILVILAKYIQKKLTKMIIGFNQKSFEQFLQPRVVSVDSSKLINELPNSKSEFSWDCFEQFHADDNFIYIFLKSTECLIIPKAQCSDEELSDFMEILSDNVKNS